MVDSALTECLTELFLLKSPNQIQALPFESIPGKEAIPFRFAIHLENGEEKKVFVKKVSREGRDPLLKGTGSSVDALKWEANFYQNFLPEIRRFLETHEGMTANIIDSCFVEYYGYNRGCTIKINLLGFSKFVYHCFLETVRIFTVSNFLYLFGIIREFRLDAKIGDARLWEQKYV